MQSSKVSPYREVIAQPVTRQWRTTVYVICTCVAALFVLVGSTLTSPLSIIDDHEIIEYLMRPDTLGQRITYDFETGGRFRPLYYALRQLQYHLFGANPFPWHLVVFVVGVVTLALFYHLLRRFVSLPYAVFGLLILLCYPNSVSIWYRLGPQETVGVLLIVIALTAFLHRHDYLFVAFVVLASAYKESFALLIPAMVALYVLFRRRIFTPQSMALVLFGVLFGAILLLSKLGATDHYGALITHGSVSGATISLLALLLPVAALSAPLLAIPYTKPREQRIALALLLLWVLPQVALYSSGLEERYLWPAILAPAFIVPVAFYRLRRSRRLTRVAIALMILVAPFDVFTVLQQRAGAGRYLQENIEFQSQIQQIVRDNPPVAHIPYSEPLQIEERASTRSYLEWYGYRGVIDFGCTDGMFCAP